MRTHIESLYRGQMVRVPIADITHFTSGEKYVTAHHRGGELITEEKMKNLEAELAGDFVRVHRLTIVRRALICGFFKDYNKDCAEICLAGSEEKFVVSRRRLPEVAAFINQGATPCDS